MEVTSPVASTASDLLSAATNIDLSRIANPPAEIEFENLRRRGIDRVRIRWELKSGKPPVKPGLLARLFGSKPRPADSTTILFVDNQLRMETVDQASPKGLEIVVPLDAISKVEIAEAKVRVSHAGATVEFGQGLSNECLEWLRDRAILEASGLVWRPVYNIGKRTTRATGNPDDEPYRRWKTSQNRLVGLYLQQSGGQISSLEKWLASELDDEWTKARANAHWLKSSSAAVGASQLSELCQRLEIEIDTGDRSRAVKLAPHIDAEYKKVTAAFQRIVEARAAEAPEPQHAQKKAAAPVDALLFGVRVLLAEDSLVNQEIARDCLEGVGCIVTAVNDGREALFSFAKGKYDIVLMDCQMSGMDGFESTRMIRDLESTTGRLRTPIVALTANALRQDRDVCLAVGMSDYVSKPFVEAELIQIVEKWLPGRVSMKPKDGGAGGDSETDAHGDTIGWAGEPAVLAAATADDAAVAAADAESAQPDAVDVSAIAAEAHAEADIPVAADVAEATTDVAPDFEPVAEAEPAAEATESMAEAASANAEQPAAAPVDDPSAAIALAAAALAEAAEVMASVYEAPETSEPERAAG